MELGGASIGTGFSRCLIVHVNKVSHVKTINRVTEELGEDPDLLWDVANQMDTEDGTRWVYSVGDGDIVASFTRLWHRESDRPHQDAQKQLNTASVSTPPRGLPRWIL